MFNFENLSAYRKAKAFNLKIKSKIINKAVIDLVAKDQLRRASLSVVLNIAEGTSRFSIADKRNFYIISRGSLIECIAILDLLCEDNQVDPVLFKELYTSGEEISKMLYTMIKDLEPKKTQTKA